jgi:hypothetical protein
MNSAFSQLKPAITARANIARIGHRMTGPQRRAQNRIIWHTDKFIITSGNFNFMHITLFNRTSWKFGG